MESLVSQLAQLGENTSETHKEIHKQLSEHTDNLSHILPSKLKQEQEERTAANNKLKQDLEELITRLSLVEENTTSKHSELRDQILTQSKNLSGEIQIQNKQLSDAFRLETDHQRQSKVDRSALAVLLSEMAIKLSESEG